MTIVNSVFIGLLIIAVLIAAVIYREKAVNLVHGFFQKEFVASRFIESLLPDDKGEESATRLDLWEIKIKATDFREIHVLSQRLVDQGVMLDRDKKWFPAKLTHNGREYKAKIRLRGDYSPHWIHVKKSWRIKFKKDDMFNGYRELNLVIPSDRGDESEHVAFELARKAGLLVPASGFTQVTMNGVDMGAYFWFDNNSAEMLEKNQYPEGEIIRSRNVISEKGFYPHGLAASDFYPVQGSYNNVIRDDATAGYPMERFWQLMALLEEADDATLEQRLPYYLNMEKFYKWSAIAWMFGSKHAGGIDNLRWYYDTTSGLFEPMLYDVGVRPVGEKDSGDWSVVIFDDYYNPFITRILEISEFRRGRNQVLWRMLDDEAFNPVPVAKKVFAEIKPYLMRGVRSRLGNELEDMHNKRIKTLASNRAYLREKLAFAGVYVNSRLLVRDGVPVLSVHVVPDTQNVIGLNSIALSFAPEVDFLPEAGAVTLAKAGAKGQQLSDIHVHSESQTLQIDFDQLYLASEREPDGLTLKATPWRLDIELPGLQVDAWKAAGSLVSLDYDFFNPVNGEPIADEYKHSPPVALGDRAVVADAPFKAIDEFIAEAGLPLTVNANELVLAGGTYEINKDLIVPVDYGLTLMPGVVLKMAPKVSILSYRALKVQGTEQAPVVIEPLVPDQAWGTVAIVNAAEESDIRHLSIGGGSETWLNGIFLSGQFSFYHSDVRIADSVIKDGRADDGLNVKKASVLVENTIFENNSSDAFDGDWVSGMVTGSTFRNNGGDGLDTSGARLNVTHSLFVGMGDKGISAGEKSTLYSFNNVVRDSGIGIASKDLSEVKAFANVFYNNRVAIALYRKKQVFGGGRINLVSSLFWNNQDDLDADAESSFEANGIGVEGWVDVPQASVTGVRQGPIGKFYQIDDKGGVVYTPGPGGASPFSAGPETEPQNINGLQLPDFSAAPIGLVEPLRGLE